MFDIDRWQEIFSTISKNKLRTFLTGFSVFWGIFMLMVLLGAGKGFENGFRTEFEDDAANAMWINPRQTSLAYKGMKPGRYLKFTNEDYEYLKENLNEVDEISAEYQIKGWGASAVTYKTENGSYTLRGVHPEHKEIEFRKIISGRFINSYDIEQNRKIAVIGETCKKELFKDVNPLGEYLHINKIPFEVVGVFEEELEQNQRGKVYVPITSSQKVFSGGNKVDEIMFTLKNNDLEASFKLEEKLTKIMAKRHQFDPNDPRAMHIRNNLENVQRFQNIFGGISAFIWFIGFGTIMAGVIGVGNIMIVVVKERTKEIGIRKALGATPFSVTALIIQESIMITSMFGYFGLVVGVFLIETASKFIPPNKVFQKPEIDLKTAIYSTVILVVAGAIAGLIPAMKAASIKPIEALRDE